jgi:hypothetical protein
MWRSTLFKVARETFVFIYHAARLGLALGVLVSTWFAYSAFFGDMYQRYSYVGAFTAMVIGVGLLVVCAFTAQLSEGWRWRRKS